MPFVSCPCQRCKGALVQSALRYRHQYEDSINETLSEHAPREDEPIEEHHPLASGTHRHRTETVGVNQNALEHEVQQLYLASLAELSTPVSTENLAFKVHPKDAQLANSDSDVLLPLDHGLPLVHNGVYNDASPLDLNEAATTNGPFLRFERRLCQLLGDVNATPTLDHPVYSQKREATIHGIRQVLDRLLRVKRESWTSARRLYLSHNGPKVDTSRYMTTPAADWHPHILSTYLLITILHSFFNVTRRVCSIILAAMRGQVKFLDKVHNILPGDIPRSLATVLESFDLDAVVHTYIMCPKCYALYPKEDHYPKHCTDREAPDFPPCGEILVREPRIEIIGQTVKMHYDPRLTYTKQDMFHWIGRFICRTGMEETLAKALVPLDADDTLRMPYFRGCSSLHGRYSHGPSSPSSGVCHDILHSPYARNFKWPDGTSLSSHPPAEIRLLFALSIDGFNPFGNHTAKQNTSSTGIYLTCLNLPLALRQRPENMFLCGVVPGGGKLSDAELDKFVELIVKDFLVLWSDGVYYSSTPAHLSGLLCRAALICIICDALAARQVAGFPPITSTNFCTCCHLPLSDIENLEKSTWQLRDLKVHRHWAEKHRTGNSIERSVTFEERGLRYTPLLLLPYFDPIAMTVVDTMHNLFLGLLQRHCRKVWGMNIEMTEGDRLILGSGVDPPVPSQRTMESARRALYSGDPKALNKFKRPVVFYLCLEKNLRRAGTKKELVSTLNRWRQLAGIITHPTLQVTSELVDSVESAEKGLKRRGDLPSKTTHPVMFSMCFLRRIALPRNPTKAQMRQILLEWTQAPENAEWNSTMPLQRFASLVPSNPPSAPEEYVESLLEKPDRRESVVLGRTILQAYKEDRANMELPPWLHAAPKNAGSVGHGKLSADEWRTFCCVNLVVTLVRLWGHAPEKPQYRMLCNYMDLVIAVETASTLVTSEADIQLYEFHMKNYLDGMKDLYKEAKIVPNHHLALHVPEFLRRFGPGPNQRTFGMERYNNVLQRIPTNRQLGKMEGTYMRVAAHRANILPFIERPEIRSQINELYDQFHDVVNEDNRGTRIHDVLSLDHLSDARETNDKGPEVRLSPATSFQLANLLNSETPGRPHYSWQRRGAKDTGEITLWPHARKFEHIVIRGIRYETYLRSPGSSNALVLSMTGELRPARIEELFCHSRQTSEHGVVNETFVTVRYLMPLSPEESLKDPYRAFDGAAGSLWMATYDYDINVVRPERILCHYAKTKISVQGISHDCYHALPLNRARKQTDMAWLTTQAGKPAHEQG